MSRWQREDLSGRRFGRLIAVKFIETRKGQTMWECDCDCGNTIVTSAGHLKSGHTTSCGCYCIERTKEALTTHGQTGTRLHNVWFGMKQRCYNPSNPAYRNYGERGVKICNEWKDSFESFYRWAVNNGYDEYLSIDRIDVNGDYSPENCRWATIHEQSVNKRVNRYITFNGETLTVSQWNKKLGFKRGTLSARIDKLHWDIERALTTPVICYK